MNKNFIYQFLNKMNTKTINIYFFLFYIISSLISCSNNIRSLNLVLIQEIAINFDDNIKFLEYK